MKNRYRVFLFMIIISFNFNIFSYTGEVVKKFKSPSRNCTGMTFAQGKLWVADRKTDKIYAIDSENGDVLKTMESPAYWPMGLSWDGKYLWNIDIQGLSDISENRDGMVHKIDTEDNTIIKSLRTPSSSPRGLAWDGKYLWCVDDRKDKVIQFNPDDGSTINSFPAPSKDSQGICYDGKYLWISDRIKDEIYMVDPKTGYVIIIADAPGPYIRDLAYDGKFLWAVDYQEDFIYKMKIRDGVQYIRKNEKKQRVILTHRVRNFGPGKINKLQTHIAIPKNRVNQEILSVSYSCDYTKIVEDKWAQKTAVFEFKDILSNQKRDAEMIVDFKSWDVRYFIYPEKVGDLNTIPKEIKTKYLKDDVKYQINHPVVQRTLKEAIGEEKNPYWIVRKLHQHLINKLYYKMDGAWDTTPTVLKNGHGSCSEYSFVFMALCKGAKIPVRYVGSTWIKGDDASMDEVYHRWIEVYLPNYGWIPTDPTHGDRELPRDQAYPIGLCRNCALITTESGGGSSTLGWTYNFNEFLEKQPKTNINIIYYSDWEPLKE